MNKPCQSHPNLPDPIWDTLDDFYEFTDKAN